MAAFPYQRCSRPSSHVALLFISLLSFDWFPLQGQHQQRSLLRHAGHQEETHRQQEMKRDNLLNLDLHRLHLSLLPLMNTSVTNLSVSPGLSTSHVRLLGRQDTLLRGQQSSRKLRYMDLFLAWSDQPTSQLSSPLIPSTSPFHGHNLFLGVPKAQLPCFRRTCMHVGYNRPICLCLCVYAGVCMLSVRTASTVWVHIVLQTFPPLCFIKKT